MIERELIEQYIPDLYAGCIVDFYMELNLNCFRGGFYKVMPDGDGELQECFIFPLIKNGFEYYSRNRGRMVFSATRTKNNKLLTCHVSRHRRANHKSDGRKRYF